MAAIRRSPGSVPNDQFVASLPREGEGNRAWLARHGDSDGILLIGGASVTDFRVRVAQSALRHDLTPSAWSECGILLEGGVVAMAPLAQDDISLTPRHNGVRRISLDTFDDPVRYPNIAVIRFAERHDDAVPDIERLAGDRGILDIPALILPWLGFAWGAPGCGNPMDSGVGLPSAAFVETVFSMAGFELTPGLSSASSCPEAIWQGARWWEGYFQGAVADADALSTDAGARPMLPTGHYAKRQEAAAVA